MNSAMQELQSVLVSALLADATLTNLIGADRVFDAPTKRTRPPYIVVARHDASRMDIQGSILSTHLIDWHVWLSQPHRCDGFAIADQLCKVVLNPPQIGGDRAITMARHLRTESSIGKGNGWTRILVRTEFKLDISQQ